MTTFPSHLPLDISETVRPR